jgi:hypothetical protein
MNKKAEASIVADLLLVDGDSRAGTPLKQFVQRVGVFPFD